MGGNNIAYVLEQIAKGKCHLLLPSEVPLEAAARAGGEAAGIAAAPPHNATSATIHSRPMDPELLKQLHRRLCFNDNAGARSRFRFGGVSV